MSRAILDGFAAAQQENQEPSSELITAAQQLYAELGERQERRDRLIAELDRFTDRKR